MTLRKRAPKSPGEKAYKERFLEVSRMEEALAKGLTVKAPANEHTEKLQVEQRMEKAPRERA